MVLLTSLLVIHGMLTVRIVVLGVRVGIVCRVRIGVVRVVGGGRGGVIVMLLVGIGVVRRRRRRGGVVSGRCHRRHLLIRTALGHRLGGRLHRDAIRGIFLHLLVEARLVLLGHLLELGLVLGGERPPALAEDDTHVDELYTGVLLHDFGAHVEGEEDEGASCTLGLLGVLVLLHVLLVQAAVLNKVPRGVVPGGRG